MKLTSKIKTMFSEETLDTLAKMCDTMRIPSVIKKMELTQQIIKRNHPDLEFSILGGATNRLVLFINGVPVKIAMDSQGFKDNMHEYALGPELQPYVPKPFETNGYILVCEPWRAMTYEEFQLRKMEIIKVLEVMSQDYLLGDVGYIARNYTNWGVNDNGDVGILDYAYIHRATENLFTCEVCGSGILRYDSTYSRLKCSNATVCNATYRYLDRKIWQGYKVDQDMIDEMVNSSLSVKYGKTFIDVTNDDGVLVKGNKKIISTRDQYLKYLQEERNMENFDTVSALDLLIDQVEAKSDEERNKINSKLNELVRESEEYDDDDVEVVVEYDPFEEEDDEEEEYDTEDYVDDDVSDADYAMSISDLIDCVSGPLSTPIADVMEDFDVSVGGIGDSNKYVLDSNNIQVNTEGFYHEGVTLEPNNGSSKKIEKNSVYGEMKKESVNEVIDTMTQEFEKKVDTIITESVQTTVVEEKKKENVTVDNDTSVVCEPENTTTDKSNQYKGIVINDVPLQEAIAK